MADFTTQITDPQVIKELPDVSILNTLYNPDLTTEQLQSLLNAVSFRKKLQTLFEFKFSDSAKEIIYNKLNSAYEQYEQNQGNTVTYTNGLMFVNGRAVSTEFGTFASGIFSEDHFAGLFISNAIMDIVFNSNDDSFTASVLAIPKFWDRLLSNADVFQYVQDNYGDILMESVKNTEISYVKYMANLIGLDFTKYNHIVNLAEDSAAMQGIWVDDAAKAIEKDSTYGIAARLMYVFGESDISNIENSQDAIDRIKNDTGLENFIIDIKVLRLLSTDSLLAKYIIDHDGRFGALASDVLNAPVALSISNIFYDENYKDVLAAFVRNDELVKYFLKSSLYPTFKDIFFNAFIATVKNVQKYTAKITSDNELLISYIDKTFSIKTLTTALSDFSETKAGTAGNIATSKGVFKIPKIFNDNSMMAISIDREVLFTNSNNELLYDEFLDKKMDDVTSNGNHILGITTNGDVISSKFVADINLSNEEVEKVMVYDDAAFIKTDTTVYSIGNFGSDANSIKEQIATNKDAFTTIGKAYGKILAVSSGNLKEVTKDGFVAYGNLDDGIVKDIFVVNGMLIILDNSGNLFEYKEDLSTVDVASNVIDIQNAQDALLVKFADNNRLVFKYNGAWLTYDYVAGGVEE